MSENKAVFHISARKVKPVTGYQVNSMADLKNLENIGIRFANKAMQSYSAMDANLVAPVSTPSITTPIRFVQSFMPGFVQAITQVRAIDDLIGISTFGQWRDEEIVQGYAERTGNAKVYQDNTTVPLASWNTNFERRSIVRFEQGMVVTRLQEERAAAENYNAGDSNRIQCALSLEVQRNLVGFYGFNNGLGRTYGFLNDPSLPAYTNLPNGASGSSTWALKTTLEIIADCLSALQALRTQSGGNIDPKKTPITMAVAMNAIDYLATPTQFALSALQWFAGNYPNVRFVSAPELNAANGAANVFYLYAEDFGDMSSDDGRVFVQMVPTKFMTVGVSQLTKGYEEDYANATAGVMCKRPWAVVRRSGC